MLLGEPPRSGADLNFVVFGIPVRVHPFFWLVAVLMGLHGKPMPSEVIIWVVAVFVSILIHEMGHALVMRRYGEQPWIVLYGLGGLAIANVGDRRPREQIIISLAGPMAGFLFAGLIVAGIAASGHLIGFDFDFFPVVFRPFFDTIPVGNALRFAPFDHLLLSLLFINIFWGVINLFPIYPLDGGRIAREIMVEMDGPQGVSRSLWLSIIAAGALAVFGLSQKSMFMALMFGYLAYMSYATLQSMSGRGGSRW